MQTFPTIEALDITDKQKAVLYKLIAHLRVLAADNAVFDAFLAAPHWPPVGAEIACVNGMADRLPAEKFVAADKTILKAALANRRDTKNFTAAETKVAAKLCGYLLGLFTLREKMDAAALLVRIGLM
ncbi:MAG: hypothetical protein LBR73_00425 [Oscillospiraceae bacterium]|jgi:hypothetical protein|nr:hypothetical protein [Oscillospiraceae bacterium]